MWGLRKQGPVLGVVLVKGPDGLQEETPTHHLYIGLQGAEASY